MTALRQEASALLAAMPEDKLLSLVLYMKNMQTKPVHKGAKCTVDISKYTGSAGPLFDSDEEAEHYIKEMRSDERF